MIFEIMKHWSSPQQIHFFSRFTSHLEAVSEPNVENSPAVNEANSTGNYSHKSLVYC